jgi:sulfite dehydrogenase (quinone) subunit SoeC
MHPAFSVIFLTTLIGTGQGLFLALYSAEALAAIGILPASPARFYVLGSILSLTLLGAGLLASFFHLGHPERAWRTATMWRTSWLSREVIFLPAMSGLVVAYTAVHYFGWEFSLPGLGSTNHLSLLVGAATVVMTLLLFLSTAMIYACIKFLQEWATPLTVVNFTLLGCAGGFTLATVYATWAAESDLIRFYGVVAVLLTLTALVTRSASLVRNSRLKPRSSPQTAIGVRHTEVIQRSQGATGGSFNTREFFHGASPLVYRAMRWLFLIFTFVLPTVLLLIGLALTSTTFLATAFLIQFIGLIAERWFFFAQANHPQNLYYQYVS